MKTALILAIPLLTGGCNILDFFTQPDSEEIATFCGVPEGDLERAKSEMKAAEPHKPRNIGKCSLVKTDSGKVILMSIQWPPKAPTHD